MRRANAGIKLNVWSKRKSVRYVIQVAQDLGLRCITLGPLPVLLQVRRELIGVLEALHIAASTWISVPVPRTTDTLSGLEYANGETEVSYAVERE
jgi:hypothetical protein